MSLFFASNRYRKYTTHISTFSVNVNILSDDHSSSMTMKYEFMISLLTAQRFNKFFALYVCYFFPLIERSLQKKSHIENPCLLKKYTQCNPTLWFGSLFFGLKLRKKCQSWLKLVWICGVFIWSLILPKMRLCGTMC